MNKLILSLFVGILLIFTFASAQESTYSESKGFDWLFNEMNTTSWTGTTKEVALSVLALRQGLLPVNDGVEILLATEDVDNWNGNLEDTAYAAFALYMTGHNVTKEIDWMLDQGLKGNTDDASWLLQIRSVNNGSCELEYGVGLTSLVTVVDNQLTCSGDFGPQVSISSCIGALRGYEPLTLDCNNLASASGDLMYFGGGDYFLLEGETSSRINLGIENLRYSDYKTTGIINWILDELGEKSHAKHYIETNIGGFMIDYGFAYQATQDQLYLDILTEKQEPSGSWEANVFTTSFNYMITKNSLANTWLKGEQGEDGSWSQHVEDTAFALFVLTPRLSPSLLRVCDNDGLCDLGEDALNCPGDCFATNVSAENCTNLIDDDGDRLVDCKDVFDCGTDASCVGVSEICDNKLDDDGDRDIDCDDTDCALDLDCQKVSEGCVVDADCPSLTQECKNGVCVKIDTGDTGDPVEPTEESNFWLWFILILLVIGVLVAGYFVYAKYKGGGSGKKKSNFNDFLKGQEELRKGSKALPPRTGVPKTRPAGNAYGKREKELDEAIRKAKDMLRKK
tara:strand:+ start:5943 stop:7640 length:1698 start_codon:yes stop_codon:yes gene_type:complete